MSSKYLTILLAVAAILLTNSCSSDDMDNILASGPVSAQVTASISNGNTATRISNISATAASFTANDIINVVAAGTDTYQYTKQGTGSWSATTPYYFTSTSSVSFKGWYAYPDVTVSTNSISIDTSDQTTNSDGWNNWDILVTPEVSASASSPTISFTGDNAFKHIMSKMTFTFKAVGGVSDLSLLTGYTIKDLTTDATFNTLSCELSTTNSTTGDISQTISGASGTSYSSSVILVPQTLTDGKFTIEVTYDGKVFSAELSLPSDATSSSALTAGEHYTYTLSITGLDVLSAAIADWNTASDEGDSYISYTYTETDGVRTYTVYNENGLRTWAEYVNAGNYGTNCKLGSDITMSTSTNWTPVGYYNNDDATAIIDNPYTGTFDGNGKTITNLTINQPYRGCVGLIGYTSSAAVIKDLTLENVTVSSDWGWNVGAVVGMNYGSVSGCNVTGTVSGSGAVGGVVGSNYDNSVIGCYFTGTVTGITGNYDSQGSGVGGVAGANYGNSSSITACYSTGTVSGSYNVGGVVGHETTLVTACYSTATVSGTGDYVGGVIGYKETGTVSACYWYNSSTDYGVGYSGSGSEVDGVTKVSSSSSSDWSTALSAMNTALTSSGWQYETNTDTSSDQPLLLVKSSTTTE